MVVGGGRKQTVSPRECWGSKRQRAPRRRPPDAEHGCISRWEQQGPAASGPPPRIHCQAEGWGRWRPAGPPHGCLQAESRGGGSRPTPLPLTDAFSGGGKGAGAVWWAGRAGQAPLGAAEPVGARPAQGAPGRLGAHAASVRGWDRGVLVHSFVSWAALGGRQRCDWYNGRRPSWYCLTPPAQALPSPADTPSRSGTGPAAAKAAPVTGEQRSTPEWWLCPGRVQRGAARRDRGHLRPAQCCATLFPGAVPTSGGQPCSVRTGVAN